MARIDNFKGKTKETQFKAGPEQVEIAKKGAAAANKSRKEKKLLKTIAQAMLEAPIEDEEYIEQALKVYPALEREQVSQGFAMLSDVVEILRKRQKIKDKNGKEITRPLYNAADRLKAYQILEATSGQKPIEKQEITNIDADGYRRILMGDEDIFEGDYGSADESDEEEEDKKE